MKALMTAMILGCCLTGFAHAADKPLSAQQSRMGECNQQATGKKGDERKAFMSACLSGKAMPAAAKLTPQQRMGECNKQATGKKGDERKAFMSSCLKG